MKKIYKLLFFVLSSFNFIFIVNAASFKIIPESGELLSNCKQTISIEIDTGEELSNAADIQIQYNPLEVTIIDSNDSIPGSVR